MCESERPGVDTEQARIARGALRCAIAGCELVGAGAPSTSPQFCTGSFRARARGQTGRQRAPAAAPAPGQRHDALKLPIRAACASPARCAHAFASPARPASRPASPLRAVGHGVPNSHRWFEAGRIADEDPPHFGITKNLKPLHWLSPSPVINARLVSLFPDDDEDPRVK